MEWLSRFFTNTAMIKDFVFTKSLHVLILLGVGIPATIILRMLFEKLTQNRISAHAVILIKKGITYSGFAILTIMIFNQLGFKVSALLGAAGIIGIAIGFAAQTSVSNIISGFFLISEKPFKTGDLIQVGTTLGIVHSIDLLSIKIRKLDNLFIRIPNETLIKNELTNITKFPIRRMDLNISVAYKEDPAKIQKILAELAAANPYCLDNPEPLILFKDFGSSALEFLFGLWFYKTDYMSLKNSIMREIKERFDKENIEIPFPHQSLYAGEATAAFPIKIINEAKNGGINS